MLRGSGGEVLVPNGEAMERSSTAGRGGNDVVDGTRRQAQGRLRNDSSLAGNNRGRIGRGLSLFLAGRGPGKHVDAGRPTELERELLHLGRNGALGTAVKLEHIQAQVKKRKVTYSVVSGVGLAVGLLGVTAPCWRRSLDLAARTWGGLSWVSMNRSARRNI